MYTALTTLKKRSINATTRDFEPTLSNMTFARLMLAAVTNDPLPHPQTPGLPAKQTAHAIMHYYMINIYPLFPLFQETVLLSALDDMYQQDRNVSSTNKWLVYMVLAIGSMAQSRSNHDECYKNGVEFVSHALQFADRALQLGSVSQIQSLALFTQYSTLDPAHFDSWQLIGATCRAVVDLGFHQDPVTQGQTDRVALDMRRKTFYCVYALDRLVAISLICHPVTVLTLHRAISMVHARAFSFSDDSINVDLPAMSGIGRIASVAGTITGPQSHDPAILLFQLRRIQSHWYQTLIQSDPNQPIEGADGDTASFIWQVCQDMREWDESLPETLPIGIRELFNLELKYSYVYCLAPSARAPVMTAYGRVLIFEYAIAYLDHVYGIATHGSADPNPSFYTYHDALRVFFMGSQFMAVLRDAGDAILAGASVPVPLSLPGKAPPPPLPTRTSNEDNLTRSIRCLERVKLTLQKYGERWLDAQSLLQSFDTLSEGLIKDLKAKQQQGLHYAAAAQAHAQAQAQAQAHARMQPQHRYHPSPPPQQYQQIPVTLSGHVPGHMPGHMSLPGVGPIPGQLHTQMRPGQYSMPMQQSPMYVTSPAMHQMSMPPPQGPPMQHLSNNGPHQPEVRWENVDISQMMRGGGM